MKDSIDLSSIARDGINSLNLIDVFRVNSCETMSWFVKLLKNIPDSEDVFPLGKWATIQSIEDQLDQCAKEYIEEFLRGRK